MNKILEKLKQGFESSSGKTPEWKEFCKLFKSEFSKELKSIGATDIVFGNGHFYISGFFTADSGQIYYFSLSDVRGMEFQNSIDFLYRTAEHYRDWTGGGNQWIKLEQGMAKRMNIR